MINIVKKTPGGNYMIMNFAKIYENAGVVKVPVVNELGEANKFSYRDLDKCRICTISKQHYDKI